MYSVWGGGAVVRSGAYNKLQTEDLDAAWSPKNKSEDDNEGDSEEEDVEVESSGSSTGTNIRNTSRNRNPAKISGSNSGSGGGGIELIRTRNRSVSHSDDRRINENTVDTINDRLMIRINEQDSQYNFRARRHSDTSSSPSSSSSSTSNLILLDEMAGDDEIINIQQNVRISDDVLTDSRGSSSRGSSNGDMDRMDRIDTVSYRDKDRDRSRIDNTTRTLVHPDNIRSQSQSHHDARTDGTDTGRSTYSGRRRSSGGSCSNCNYCSIMNYGVASKGDKTICAWVFTCEGNACLHAFALVFLFTHSI